MDLATPTGGHSPLAVFGVRNTVHTFGHISETAENQDLRSEFLDSHILDTDSQGACFIPTSIVELHLQKLYFPRDAT